MSSSQPPIIGVAGQAPYSRFVRRLTDLSANHSIEVVFEEMTVGSPSFGYMIDTLEYLAKAGVVAIDIWHPDVQAVTSATEWSQSAERAGSADFLTLPDTDFSIPSSHNLSFEATLQSMQPEEVEGAKVVVITDEIPATGIRAALLARGARDVTIVKPDGLVTTSGGGIANLTLDLSPQAMRGRNNAGDRESSNGLAPRWLAARLVAALERGLHIETPAGLRDELIDFFQRGS